MNNMQIRIKFHAICVSVPVGGEAKKLRGDDGFFIMYIKIQMTQKVITVIITAEQ